jgi:hypothetical protein
MEQVSWTPLAVRPDHRKRKTSDGPSLQLAPPARGGGDGSQGGYLPAAVAEEADDDFLESSAPLSSGPAPGSASLKRRSSFSLEINPDEPETPPLRRGSSFGSTGDVSSGVCGSAASPFEGTLQQAAPPPVLPIRIGGGFQDLSPSSPVSGASSRRGAAAAGAEPGAVCSRGARVVFGLAALLMGAALLLRLARPLGGEPKLQADHPGAAASGAAASGATTGTATAITMPPSLAQGAEPAAADGAAAAAAAATSESSPLTLLLVAVLLAGACALFVSAARTYRRWRDSERVMMVLADDDLNKLVERARAEWRAGRFAQTGQGGVGLSTHLEPNAAQRAWAAERIASLERA